MPQLIKNITFINEFQDFHDYYNHKYRESKGDVSIFIEFGILIYLFVLLTTSFFQVFVTEPGAIPNDSTWKINVPENLNNNLMTEVFSYAINKREKYLLSNKNYLFDHEGALDKSNSTEAESIDISNGSNILYVVNERTSTESVRYCLYCKAFKPDRCHHCKHCNRCILKMDHHCPWVGNCIGYHNYKFFVLMIFYGFLNSLYFTYIYKDVIRFLILEEKIINLKLIIFLGLYMFMIIIMLSLFIFLVFHLWITMKNYSTYEYITKVIRTYNNSDDTVNEEKLNSRYNIDTWANFTQVFGTNIFLWFIPISSHSNKNFWENGLNYKVNNNFALEVIESV